MRSREFVILDRDGTIVRERQYLSDPEHLELLPGSIQGLERLRDAGMNLVVVTNQSGVGRGYFSEDRLTEIHRRLRSILGEHGITLAGIYHCPHLPSAACACRKPESGLVLQAARELDLQPERTYFVGDKECDIALGARLGGTTILVRTGYGVETEARNEHGAAHVVDNLNEVADLIIDRKGVGP